MSTPAVLMVAEKPSLARSIAQILSSGASTTRQGTSPVCPVHEWHGHFQGRPALLKMTATVGHVYSLDFTDEFQVQYP